MGHEEPHFSDRTFSFVAISWQNSFKNIEVF